MMSDTPTPADVGGLLPCPFCGAEQPKSHIWYSNGGAHECQSCRASSPVVSDVGATMKETEPRIIAAWNARTPPATGAAATYGNCPTCGAPGFSRERRPNGNDTCNNGHTYPSATAIRALPAPDVPEAVRAWVTRYDDTDPLMPMVWNRNLRDWIRKEYGL